MSVSESANGYVVTYTTKQGRTMKAILYGPVTPERIAAAKAELVHRAEQLFWIEAPTPAKDYRSRRASSEQYHPREWEYDEFDEDDEDDLD